MKKKGMLLMAVAILGAIFVLTFDIIVGKPEYSIGIKSIIALIACAVLLITGLRLLKK